MITEGKKQDELVKILAQFKIPEDEFFIEVIDNGIINSTFSVKGSDGQFKYILQKKNGEVFKDIPGMMDNIVKVTDHLREQVKKRGGNPDTEVLKIINSKDNLPFVEFENFQFWTLTVFINNTKTIDKATDTSLAYKAGQSLGEFQLLLSGFDETLKETIPGFHNLAYRLKQWDECKNKDAYGRVTEIESEIKSLERRRQEMTEFWQLVEDGKIPKRVTHNDTKLSNFLFNEKDEIQCVIDLDTVMKNTVLADYGDAIRSFASNAAEDEKDLNQVTVNKDILQAYKKGYLSKASSFLNNTEKEWLDFAPRYITFEQALRFLMDYIEGDVYYKIDYPDHNLIRARNQLNLLEELEKIKK